MAKKDIIKKRKTLEKGENMRKKNDNIINIYWDSENETPLILDETKDKDKIKKYEYLTTDIRPVFLEEKHLMFCLFPKITKDIYFKSVWTNKQGRYFINGEKLNESAIQNSKKIENKKEFIEKINNFKMTKEMEQKEKIILEKFILLNKERYQFLIFSEGKDKEGYFRGAEPFIRELVKNNKERIVATSFSGGKDSIAVSHLVRKALNNQGILHIFGDTTLELPKTYEFVKKFQENNDKTPFLIERNNENDFFEISKKIGPPSRVKSWCCSIFKTGPMGTTFAEINEKILMFYGIRRSESASRSKYTRVTNSPKIEKQKVASPIIDWLDVDVWLYILTEKFDFNSAYRQGFSRVGCWCCPNNSSWSDFLGSIYNPTEYKKWKDFLLEFAKGIGKKDYKDYVEDGKWKARQGGAGLEIAEKIRIEAKECVAEDNSKSYELFREVDKEFFELFKPFGKLNFELGNQKIGEVFILDKNDEIKMKILAKKGSRKVRITTINIMDKYIFSKIEKQLRKFNTCIYCKACNSACPFGAISVVDNSYTIDEKVCTHCLKCIDHFSSGCLIASSLVIKRSKK